MAIKRSQWLYGGLAAALVLPVQAGNWERSGAVEVGSYYSTNICQVNADLADEEEKVVGTFRPSFKMSGSGGRSSMYLDAAAEYNSLAESSIVCPAESQAFDVDNRKPWVPRISFLGSVEAIEDWLELYSRAFATQSAINPFLSGGQDNENALGNTNIIYQVGAGARVARALPDNWNLLLDTGYNKQYNSEDDTVGGSTESRANFDIGKAPFASRFFYGARGNYSEIDFDATDFRRPFTNRLSSAEIYMGMTLWQNLAIEGVAGDENNVFTSTDDDIDGAYWDVGIRWQPLERLSVAVGYGERFFGDTPRFDISYGHKRSQLTASYYRDVQFPRNLRSLEDQVTGDLPPSTPAIPDVPGESLDNGGLPTFIGNTPIKNESFSLGYSHQGRRSDFSLSANLSEQLQLSTGQLARFHSAEASLRRRLTPSMVGDIRLRWSRNERSQSVNPVLEGGWNGYRLELGLSRPLGSLTSVSMRYRYYDQQAVDEEPGESSIRNYTDHRVTLTITHNF